MEVEAFSSGLLPCQRNVNRKQEVKRFRDFQILLKVALRLRLIQPLMWFTLNPRKVRKWLMVSALLGVILIVSGCQTLSFYGQAIKGQYQLLAYRHSIENLLADPSTTPGLKTQLELVQSLRVFAAKELKLPVDGHYTKYVDVHRRFVVWNVEAAPEFSMEPKTWWYPIVGSLKYRGYFSERNATNYGAALARRGYDVFVGGVDAYSTLGWFRDPVLNTFIFNPEPDLAETIFHELGHQRVFARSDTDFNEAFATTVGEEGARRWLRNKGNDTVYQRYLAEIRRTRQFARLITATREQLEALYGDDRTEEGKIKATKRKLGMPPKKLRDEKQRIMNGLQAEYAKLKKEWHEDPSYDSWFARQVNNAQLNSVAAYYDLVPGFEHLLELNGGDLQKFYAEAERLSKMPKKERHQWLTVLGKNDAKTVKSF
jgi:predicted aminopeptidase